MDFKSDVAVAKPLLASFPTDWEGKETVLRLKESNYIWRHPEWWAYYFELLCRTALKGEFQIPGDEISFTRSNGSKTKVKFDSKRNINWDFKAKAIKSDEHKAILNDVTATDLSIQNNKSHGAIIALCDVEYNDVNRVFQEWHENLKGGKSKYTIAREQRTSVSRYRKTHAALSEILFIVINSRNVQYLDIYNQGRNSNGKPRPPKYMINLENADKFLVDSIIFDYGLAR